MYNENDILRMKEKLEVLKFLAEKKDHVVEQANSIADVRVESQNDLSELKKLINYLKTFYNNMKIEKMEKIQNAITEVVNNFFDDNHVFKLQVSVERNNTNINLITERKDGSSSGSVKVTTSDAQQQMIGYLLQGIVIREMGSQVILLDEPFSSFGVEEIQKISDILETLSDSQHIIIEHKPELIETLEKDLGVTKYTMRKRNGVVTTTVNNDEESIIEEWGLTEDKNTLIKEFIRSW